VRHLDTLKLHPKVSSSSAKNGSGKSTLIEAIAVAAGLQREGRHQQRSGSAPAAASPRCIGL